MKMRVLAALVLIPVLLAIVFVAPPVFLAIAVGIVCAIGAFELLKGTGFVQHTRLIIYTMVMAFAVPVCCYFGMQNVYALLGIFLFTLLLFGEVICSHGAIPCEKLGICFVGGLLIPYFLSTLVRLMGDGSTRWIILIPFVLAYMADTGAYFIGCAFGKHKLAPTISPKKSVEGLVGGVTTAILGMMLYCFIMQNAVHANVNYGYAVIYGFVGALAGTFGDLSFSAIKRQAGIKDYGNLIPGHGGVLDRFDSVIVVAPLTELLLALLPVME